MQRILSSYKLLIFSLILFVVSAGILLFRLNQYNTAVNYFGNNLLGNGFWLHPQNKVVKAVKKYESFRGVLSAMNRTTNAPGYFALGIEPYKNSPIEEQFNFLMPTKVDLENAVMLNSNDLAQPPVILGQNLADMIPVSSSIEVELQSNWNSNKYEEVTKIIVWKQ